MGRLIDAYWLEEKLKKALKSIEDTLFEAVLNGDEELSKAGQNQHSAYSTALTLLKHAPTVDAVPVVHGIWLNFYGDYSTAECDQCAALYEVSPDIEPREEYFEAFSKFYKFCPDCGADMRKEKKCDARIL